MEDFAAAAYAALAALLAAVVPVGIKALLAALELLRQRAEQAVQARLGEGASRIAGEIAATIAGSPELRAASRAMVDAGGRMLAQRFADTVRKRGIPAATLAGMVAGELGKMNVAVEK